MMTIHTSKLTVIGRGYNNEVTDSGDGADYWIDPAWDPGSEYWPDWIYTIDNQYFYPADYPDENGLVPLGIIDLTLDYTGSIAFGQEVTGFVATALYSDGSIVDVTDMCTFSPFSNGDIVETSGNVTVTAEICGVTAQYTVTVEGSWSKIVPNLDDVTKLFGYNGDADWSGYQGDDTGYEALDTGNQYVNRQTIIDTFRYLSTWYTVSGFNILKTHMREGGGEFMAAFWSDSLAQGSGYYSVEFTGGFYLLYAADKNILAGHTSGSERSYTMNGKTVYYSYWDRPNNTGNFGLVVGEWDYWHIANVCNSLSNYAQNVSDVNLAAWAMVYGPVQQENIDDMTDDDIWQSLHDTNPEIFTNTADVNGDTYYFLKAGDNNG